MYALCVLVRDNDNKKIKNKLSQPRLYRCAAILEELISPILLAQFLGCVIVWCMLIFYMTMVTSARTRLTVAHLYRC